MMNEFDIIVSNACKGKPEAVEQLLKMFMPLIIKNSMLAGTLDEDCRQFISMKFVASISKFSIQK